MRKQLVVARGLPAQRVPQRVGVDLDQEQPGLPKEMLPRRLGHLRGCGKMNEAVADIVGAAPVHALPLGLAPGRSGTDFVDPAHLPRVLPATLSLLLISRKSPEPAPTVSTHPAHFKGRIQALAPHCK